jgi:hypothetical protein
MTTERHNVNLSRQVWGELKLRAFQERISASELIAYLVKKNAKVDLSTSTFSRYQARDPDDDRMGRTVFFPSEVWEQVKNLAARNSTSVSVLIDYLLKVYLGLLEKQEKESSEPPSGKAVLVGNERVYLGDNPIEIDLKTGNTTKQ